jgi:hydrogenase-4 component B
MVLLAMTGALALACFVKACGVVFLGAPRSADAAQAKECGGWMRAPMLALAAGCVAIGLLPAVFWPAIHSAVAAWQGTWIDAPAPESLRLLGVIHAGLALSAIAAVAWLRRHVRRGQWASGPTWDCGYAAPTPRMQYTAGSFAGIITDWFAWVLRPQRHERRPEGPFPRQAAFEQHTPETVLERLIEPAARQVMVVAGMIRRLQHGRVQAYLLYVLLGLVAMAILALTRRP